VQTLSSANFKTKSGAGPSRMGGCGGCDTPLKTSCRQMKGFVGKRKIIYHKTLS
jgi:hypothetical protein